MIEFNFVRLTTWPGPQTTIHRKAPFRRDYTGTHSLVDRELRMLAAKTVVLQADVETHQIRLDGQLKATATPKTPAIILSFNSKYGPMSYPYVLVRHSAASRETLNPVLEAGWEAVG